MKLVVLMFLIILLVPLYGWIVQVVNGLGSRGLVKSFGLKGARALDSSGVFHIGETVGFWAESEFGNAYVLTIFNNSSVVFLERGEFVDGRAEVEVVLSSWVFSAKVVYVVTFDVYVFNYPILGAFSSDSVSSVFEVVSVETRLQLNAEYDGTVRSLRLYASLTDVEGYPVSSETVEFLLQSKKRSRVADGWFPLGSVETAADGAARFNLAFGLPNGNYSIKAVHEGNDNFGKSENVSFVQISSSATSGQ